MQIKPEKEGRLLFFKTGYVVQDDNLSTDFYKKGLKGYEYYFKHNKDKDKNNNDGAMVLEGSFFCWRMG